MHWNLFEKRLMALKKGLNLRSRTSQQKIWTQSEWGYARCLLCFHVASICPKLNFWWDKLIPLLRLKHGHPGFASCWMKSTSNMIHVIVGLRGTSSLNINHSQSAEININIEWEKHMTKFQLILPVQSQNVTKNRTDHRMHVEGPQICQINSWNNSF